MRDRGPVSYTHLDVYKRQGKQRPISRALFPQVICVADGLAIQVELDGLCNNDSFRDVNILQQLHFAAYGNSLLQRQIEMCIRDSRNTFRGTFSSNSNVETTPLS